MPLKLSVGALSRKVGQPGFGSIGARLRSVEDGARIRSPTCDAPDEFHARGCNRRMPPVPRPSTPSWPGSPHAPTPTITHAPVTAQQANRGPGAAGAPRRRLLRGLPRRLGTIARSRGIEADQLLAERGLDAGSVSSAEASRLISGLRAAAAG